MPAISKRELLIQTAVELFASQGFHATGIAAILAESGVSKKTLYHHFRSKDELVLAALRHYDGLFRNQFMRQVEAAGDSPRDRLLGVFDVAKLWFSGQNFYGCLFINAVGEYAAPDSPVREISKAFKKLMGEFIHGLCRQLAVARPEELATSLALLLEGAIVTAQVSGKPEAAQTAKKAATVLIDQALSDS